MKDLHGAGFKKEDILGALRILPFVSYVYTCRDNALTSISTPL